MSDKIITKRCCHCKQIKPLSDFGKNKSRKDFRQNYCKICGNKYNKKYTSTDKFKNTRLRYRATDKYKVMMAKASKKCYLAHIGQRASYHKKYNQTDRGKEVMRISTEKQRRLHPEKRKAGIVVNNAIWTGKLSRSSIYHCRYCWKQAQQYHHHRGYAREHWLDVQPVCCRCHVNIHHFQ
jgi:hypothetical protein